MWIGHVGGGYFTIMGIAEFPVATLTTDRAAAILRKQKQPRRLRDTFHISPLWVCLLIALALRVWLTVRTHGVIDGDEAMVGIQAEHILRGEHPLPTYFYGQVYMGSLEAYLVAILFKIAGPSVWTLRAEPILLSLVVVWLTGKLAQALTNVAKLPARAKQCFITTATLFAAVSPVYDTVLELHTLGGYIETFILMLALLLSAFRLTQRWHEGATSNELALRWVGIGFCIGLGLWVDPLIVSAILAVALWIVGYCMGKSFKHLVLAVAAIPAFLLGAFPAILWGAMYHWANVTYLLQSGNQPVNTALQQLYPTRLGVIGGMVWFYGNTMIARLIGGAIPGEDAISATLHTGTTLVGLLCICITLVLVAGSFFSRLRMMHSVRQLVMLPLLFGICSAAVFCTSPTSTGALLSPRYDVAGRYATPLMLVLPFFFATAITGVILWMNAGRDGRDVKEGEPGVKGNGRDYYLSPGEGAVPTVAWIVQGILFVLLLFSLGMQSASYGMVNPAATFQSPSCPIAPANNDPIIAYLQKEHVHYAWAVPWIGNAITFKTNDGIITADPRPLINFIQITRINAYLRDVSLANRPAILTFVPHNDPYPLLLWILDTKHVTYRAAYFPSEPGTDVLVVTGLSRTISLYESPYMRDVFGNCI